MTPIAFAPGVVETLLRCGGCGESLFVAVARCPFCGRRDDVQVEHPVQDTPVMGGDQVLTEHAGSGREAAKTTKTIVVPPRQRRREGLSNGMIAIIVAVIVIIATLWFAENRPGGDEKPLQTITADAEWQPLEAPPGTRIVADAPFRLRLGPDLYVVPLGVGVAVPAPADGETFEIRAARGVARLEVYR